VKKKKTAKKAVTRAVVARKPAKRKSSKFAKTGKITKKVKNRFQKFYYLHRPALNTWRRGSYKDKKKKGICVKCKKKALKTSIFCQKHLLKSRIYNRR